MSQNKQDKGFRFLFVNVALEYVALPLQHFTRFWTNFFNQM